MKTGTKLGLGVLTLAAMAVPTAGSLAVAPDEAAAALTAEQVTKGRQLFTDNGCNACHTLADAGATGDVGPSLDELGANAPQREPGTEVAAYVEQSIVDPRAFVVEGFPDNVMPTDYGDQLSPEEIDALVQYLLGASR